MEGLKQVKRGEHCQEWEGPQEVGSTTKNTEDCRTWGALSDIRRTAGGSGGQERNSSSSISQVL